MRAVLYVYSGDIAIDEPTRSAGKSTLLRILAGKRLTKSRDCRILGQDVFMNPPNVSDDAVLTRRRGDAVARWRGER
jgi:predicted ABC-type transport system involved in lysophospholipase L1 biosynthesis ATPase subunit